MITLSANLARQNFSDFPSVIRNQISGENTEYDWICTFSRNVLSPWQLFL